MIKRIICFLAAMLLMALPAAAEPRYPSRSGVATDTAAVLSIGLLDDLRTLDKRLDKADVPQIYIVTVDFLDGTDVESYANALFERWRLDEDEMLLLLAVGEEKFAFCAGREVDRLIAPATQEKLLASTLQQPFMDQQFDAAVSAFLPALVRELSKACGESVRTDDLFDSRSTSLIVNWAANLSRSEEREKTDSIFTREDKNSGFSLLKIVLIVGLLMIVFGSFRKMRRTAKPRRARHIYAKPSFSPRRPRR